jgi:hypothetical protein
MQKNHDRRIADMIFASVYPLYIAKLERKGRTKAELHQVIEWLTAYDEATLLRLLEAKVTFEFFSEKQHSIPMHRLLLDLFVATE